MHFQKFRFLFFLLFVAVFQEMFELLAPELNEACEHLVWGPEQGSEC